MPITNDSLNKDLYRLLKVRGYDPVPIDSKGAVTPVPDDADVFKFTFKQNGKEYGKAWITVDSNKKLVVYYDDDVTGAKMNEDELESDYDSSWTGFLKNLKMWAQRRQLGFDLQNQDHLASDMAQRTHMKQKENVSEGYYPMGKQASYNDSVPTIKIVLQHTRQIQEGEQRFRHINKIFLENEMGERILAPTIRPGIAQVYARHLAEGGIPNDDRWNHIKSLCEEYSKMAGFVRAVRGSQFNESAQRLVEAGLNHYTGLRETLGKMRGHRGYSAYFESWTPTLMETESDESNLNELFVQETLDPRIESVMPILSRLKLNLGEMKEVNELAEWADGLLDEQTDLKSIPESEKLDELSAWKERGLEDPRSYPTRSEKAARRGEGDTLSRSPEEKEARAKYAAYGHKDPTEVEKQNLKKKIKSRLSHGDHRFGKPDLPEQEQDVAEGTDNKYVVKHLKPNNPNTYMFTNITAPDIKTAKQIANKKFKGVASVRRLIKDYDSVGVAEDMSDAEKADAKIKTPAYLRKEKVTTQDLEKAKEKNISSPEGLKALKSKTGVNESEDAATFWVKMKNQYGGWDKIDWLKIGVMHGKKNMYMNPPYGVGAKALNLYDKGFDKGASSSTPKHYDKNVSEGASKQEMINSAETMTLDQFVDVYGEENAHIWHQANKEQGVAEGSVDPKYPHGEVKYRIVYRKSGEKVEGMKSFSSKADAQQVAAKNPEYSVQAFRVKQGVAEGSSTARKPFVKLDDPKRKEAADKQKQQMAKDKAAEPGKKLLGKIEKKSVEEDLDSNQKRVGQLGPTEKVGPKGAVGKLVGANESVDTGEYDARKKQPSSKEEQDKVFAKHRERMKNLDKDEKKEVKEGQDDLDAILRIIRK